MQISNALMQKNYLGINYIKPKEQNNIRNKNKEDEKKEKNNNNLALNNNINNLIENYNKQKRSILELKEAYLKMAKSKGLSDDEIEAKLATYEEQIASIDKKINEVYGYQRKQEIEKLKKEKEEKEEKQEKVNSKNIKEDIQKDEIKNVVDISITLDGIRNNNELKAKLDRDKTRLSIEIKKDIERMGYSDIVRKKQSELMDLEDNISKIVSKNYKNMFKINDILEENNESKDLQIKEETKEDLKDKNNNNNRDNNNNKLDKSIV